jgi:hypothetical protein
MRHATLGLIVTLTLGLLLSPLASAAQPSPKVYQIGTLWLGFSAPASSSVFFGKALFKAFQQDLHDLGYVEGRNLVFEHRHAPKQERSASRPRRRVGPAQRGCHPGAGDALGSGCDARDHQNSGRVYGPGQSRRGQTRRQPRPSGRQSHRADHPRAGAQRETPRVAQGGGTRRCTRGSPRVEPNQLWHRVLSFVTVGRELDSISPPLRNL